MMTAGTANPTLLYGVPIPHGEATMSDSGAIMRSLIEALPEDGSVRAELAALGAVTAGVVMASPAEDRAGLVEHFCNTLRKHVATELN